MTIAALLIIPIPLLLGLPAILVTLFVFGRALQQRALLQGKNAVGGVVIRKKQEVIVLDSNGNDADLGSIIYCFVSPLLSTMVINGNQRRYYVLVMPDSLPPNKFRHLRIHLNSLPMEV